MKASVSAAVGLGAAAALGQLAAVLLAACQPGDGPAVSWAERSRRRVQVVGDTVKRRRGEVPPARSALFDGSTLRLRAARGEVLGVQVLLQGTERVPVSLSIPVAGVTVEGFEVGFLEVIEPSTPGEYGHSTGQGAYPDVLRPASGAIASDDQVFFDVTVAASAPPGRHRGELVAGPDRFAVELTVEPIEIRVEREPWVWVWYKTAELMREHGMPDQDGPQQLAIERAYSDLFRRHGCLLASDYHPERLRRRLHLLTPDVRFWPVALSKDDTGAMARQAAAWVAFFRGRPQLPFTFTIDEPEGRERELVRRHAEVVHAAGGGPDTLPFLVTDAAAPIYRGAVDIFCSPLSIPAPPGWGPPTRFWTYNGVAPRAGNMTIDKPGTALRTWGWIGARYGVELWFAWEGMYYRDRYNAGPDAPRTDVLRNPLNDDERRSGGDDWGNGDGLLMYPGPMPSLRLKALRRGLQDRLLLRRLATCGAAGAAAADAIASRMVPAALGAVSADDPQLWPDDEPPWEAARQDVLDAILARCSPARSPALRAE